ncbi:MAG: PRC-barrel domain-containing protein, partial [Pseudomonadota bacterium]
EGSGMTTAAPASTTTVADGTAGEVSPMEMNQGVDAAVETDVPDLDDGSVVANERTPATAVIEDGEVSTDMEVDMQADAGAGPNTLGIAADALGAAPAVTRAGYDPVLAQDVVLPRLVGQGVFNAQDERIGEIGGVLDGESPQVVLDVGGFLGIGEKEVAVPVDALTFLSGGAELRVYVDATQDQLESLPAYEG